jgi:hypothetical protein
MYMWSINFVTFGMEMIKVVFNKLILLHMVKKGLDMCLKVQKY